MIVTAGRIEEDHGDSAKRVKHCCRIIIDDFGVVKAEYREIMASDIT